MIHWCVGELNCVQRAYLLLLTNQRTCRRKERIRGEIKQTHVDSHRDSHRPASWWHPCLILKLGAMANSRPFPRTCWGQATTFYYPSDQPHGSRKNTQCTHSDSYTADTHTHIQIPIFTRTLIPAHMHSHTRTHTHTGSHPCTHIHSNSRIHALYTHSLTRVHTHSHLLAHALTHSLSCSHTKRWPLPPLLSKSCISDGHLSTPVAFWPAVSHSYATVSWRCNVRTSKLKTYIFILGGEMNRA